MAKLNKANTHIQFLVSNQTCKLRNLKETFSNTPEIWKKKKKKEKKMQPLF